MLPLTTKELYLQYISISAELVYLRLGNCMFTSAIIFNCVFLMT